MKLNPESLARASSRHPWRVVAIWILVVTAMGFASQKFLADALTTDVDFTNNPESKQAMQLIEKNVTGEQRDTEFFIVTTPNLVVHAAPFEDYVRQVQQALTELGPNVVAPPAPGQQTSVITVYDLEALAEQTTDPTQKAELQAQAASLVSKDQKGTLIVVPIVDTETATVDRLKEVHDAMEQEGSFDLLLAGPATLNADTTKVAEEDLRKSEMIGVAIALVVLVVVFGALIAALLPLSIAFVAIPIAFGGIALIARVFGLSFSIFTTNIATSIGLAVGIDYSLFILARYREERKKGFDPYGAIGASGATASRAVFFSGLTVVFALMGMFIMPNTIFRSMAAGAMLVVVASIAGALTLLPALMGLLKDRINWPRLSKRARMEGGHDPKGGFWDRLTNAVMAKPVMFLVISVAFLGGLGALYFTIDKGTTQSAATLPDTVDSKQAFIVLSTQFAAGGRTDPVQVYVGGDLSSPDVQAAIAKLQEGIAADPAFSDQPAVQPGPNGDAVVVSAIPIGDSFGHATIDGVRRLRDAVIPSAFEGVRATVLVGGFPAIFADFFTQTDTYQPIVLTFVLGLSFLLLMVVFRSVVVPLKAVIMNLLSVGAAYGALVLVFQEQSNAFLNAIHNFALDFFNLIGFQFQEVQSIEAWLPLMLFSILFGLSMDYHVFLLSRIREEYDRTGDNTEAVGYGLRTTAGIITGAAIIMVAVFTSFAAGRLVPLQQMGFGLAVAVFMDATVVRSVLVPASMRLLGDLNWYLPSWLEWLPRVNVEGHEPEQRVLVPEMEPVLTASAEPEVIPADD
jgi:RND superfamily putative drug exporter